MYVLRWKLISCRGKCNVKNLIKITKQYQFHNKFDRLSGLKFQDGKSILNMSEIQRKKPKKYSNYFQTVSYNFSVWIDKAPTTHTSHHHDMQKKLKLEKASRSLSNEKVYMRRTHMRRNAWVKLPPAAAASYPGTDPGCSVSDLLSANAHAKAAEGGPKAVTRHPCEIPGSSWLPALTWLSASRCGLLVSEPKDGRALLLFHPSP